MESAGAALTVFGLTVEVVALYRILRSVGMIDDAKGALRRSRLARLWPWYTPPPPRSINVSMTAEATASASADVQLIRPTDRPAPTSFEEVGERLRHLAADLNSLEERFSSRTREVEDQMRNEIGEVTREAGERHRKIEERVESYVQQVFAQRRTETVAFAGGVFLQLVGAALILAG